MLNLKMSDAVSLLLICLSLSYTSFPVQSTSKYLLLVVCVCKPKLNLNCKYYFTIRKFKTQVKMTYYLGKSAENICNVSDFRIAIFESVSGSFMKDLIGNYIGSKNVCKVTFSN